jgi:Fe-S oxidoreductase
MDEEATHAADDTTETPEDEELQALSEDILNTVRRCRNCNYCFSVCPLRISTRGFQIQTPSGILQALYYGIRWDAFSEEDSKALCEVVYNCTTCNSCVLRCKDKSAGMPLVEVIEKGRTLLVEKMLGPLRDQRTTLASIQRYGNPYQRPAAERMPWIANESVKRIPQEPADTVLFVGCTTSYEPELFPLGRTLIGLLNRLNVDFGILSEESCCGDPVLRLGDRMLFKSLADENLTRFSRSGADTIVTISPHCMNVFKQDYGEMSGSFTIKHYTEFLGSVVKTAKPSFTETLSIKVTYHDPCYLSKHNNITEAPRDLLRMIPGVTLVEMKDNGKNSLCCGAGGGRMYAEMEETDRLANIRIRQALDTEAEVLATSCPYCHVMLANAVRDLGLEEKLKVYDVAELLAHGLQL